MQAGAARFQKPRYTWNVTKNVKLELVVVYGSRFSRCFMVARTLLCLLYTIDEWWSLGLKLPISFLGCDSRCQGSGLHSAFHDGLFLQHGQFNMVRRFSMRSYDCSKAFVRRGSDKRLKPCKSLTPNYIVSNAKHWIRFVSFQCFVAFYVATDYFVWMKSGLVTVARNVGIF